MVIEKDLDHSKRLLKVLSMLHALLNQYIMYSNFIRNFQELQQHQLMFFLQDLLIIKQEEAHMVLDFHITNHYENQRFQLQNMQIFEYLDLGQYIFQLLHLLSLLYAAYRKSTKYVYINSLLNYILLISHQLLNEK